MTTLIAALTIIGTMCACLIVVFALTPRSDYEDEDET